MTQTAAQTVPSDPLIRAAGGFAIVGGIIGIFGVVFLILMFVLFASPNKELGLTFGMLNDICVALQYLLTIPIALALYRILLPYNAPLIGVATILGVVASVAVIVFQLLLIFGVMTFDKQVAWASISILTAGAWMVITGYVARATGRMPNSVLMGWLAAPYFGYPVWAFWLGRLLLRWF